MQTADEAQAKRTPGAGRRRLLLLLLALAAAGCAAWLLPIDDWLQSAIGRIEALGWWGPLAFVGLYILCCVLLVPGSVLTLGAGAAFGLWQGTLAVSAGATLGAAAAFLVGRHLARRQVAARVAGNVRFAAVDEAVGRQGFRIVLLTRLSPVFPFNLQNYAYGLTRVSLRDYVLASWLGMIPGTVLFVFLGAAARDSLAVAGGEAQESWGHWVVKGLGLAATVVVTVLVTRIARRALAAAAPGAESAVSETTRRSTATPAGGSTS